jgi:hypothetical protein
MSTIINPQVGDEVTHIRWTDATAGWVKSVSKSGNTVEVEYAQQTLLNGANSGEPDALKVSPGGFVGHTSGVQRWKIERTENTFTQKFTRRSNGRWLVSGQSMKSPGGDLIAGHHPHYDFNF